MAPSLETLLLDDLDLPRDGTMRDIVETVQRILGDLAQGTGPHEYRS